jgi:AcrR family transcriptional regulator
VTTPAPATDGRSARSQRTREAVVDALLALIRDGEPRPTARAIAERASVSLRSVYVHFDDLEDLFVAVAERQMAVVGTMIHRIALDAPLEARITDMCSQRARIFEEVGPVRRAAALQAPTSPTLSSLLTKLRSDSRDMLARVFRPELDALSEPARRARLAALDAMLSPEGWDLIRSTHGLSFGDARQAVIDGAIRLLSEAHR